jgi:membrane protein DedA with SNARE-associated domain
MWIERYADFLSLFLHANVILSPLLLLTIEEMGIPILIPGDAILTYVGSTVKSAGPSVSLITATVVAVIAVLIGSSILYYVSKRWGRRIVHKIGKFIFLKDSDIERAEHLFHRFGVLTIIFGRHIPGMRAPVTIFAAISGIRYSVFILCTLISTIAWAIFWLLIGHHYGGSIKGLVERHALPSLLIIIFIILLFIGYHFYGDYREKRNNKRKVGGKKE